MSPILRPSFESSPVRLFDEPSVYEDNITNIGSYSMYDDPILDKIATLSKQVKRQYADGGIGSSRILSTEILLQAPENYFDEYTPYVQELVKQVQNEISDERSEIVSDAQLDPTNTEKQNKAYYTVAVATNNFIQNVPLTGIKRDILHTLVCNEVVGFSRIEPLWQDNKVTEIICNGPFDVQVEIGGQIYRVPSCKFDDAQHLNRLLERLFRAIGKVLSQNTPRVKGRLHDKSRLHAVHTAIAPDGPNFNIRKHPEGYWTPNSIINKGTATPELMEYIGNLIHRGCSVLVFGAAGSGKTSLMNALTGFYPDNHRIVSMEDNLEMKINPRKSAAAAMECRPEAPDQPGSGVTMRDLVQASTQMRPDVVIVGEITDGTAYDLCQSLNTGHYGMSTVHANNPQAAITRMCSLVTQSGMANLESAQEIVKEAFDIIVEVGRLSDGSRKILSVYEVATNSETINGRLTLPVKPLWVFKEDSKDEHGKIYGHWEQLAQLSDLRSQMKMLQLKPVLSWQELQELSCLPNGAKEE